MQLKKCIKSASKLAAAADGSGSGEYYVCPSMTLMTFGYDAGWNTSKIISLLISLDLSVCLLWVYSTKETAQFWQGQEWGIEKWLSVYELRYFEL